MFQSNKILMLDMFKHVVAYPLYNVKDNSELVNLRDHSQLLKLDQLFGKALTAISEEDLILLNTSFWGVTNPDFKVPMPYSRKGIMTNRYFREKSIFSQEPPTFSEDIKNISTLLKGYIQLCKEKRYLLEYGKKMRDKFALLADNEQARSFYNEFNELKKRYQHPHYYWNITNNQRRKWDTVFNESNTLFPLPLKEMTDCQHTRFEVNNSSIKCENCHLLAYEMEHGEIKLIHEEGIPKYFPLLKGLQMDKPKETRIDSLKWLIAHVDLFNQALDLSNDIKALSADATRYDLTVKELINKKISNSFLSLKPYVTEIERFKDVSAKNLYEKVSPDIAIHIMDKLEVDKILVEFQASPENVLLELKHQATTLSDAKNEYLRTFNQSGKDKHLHGVELPFERIMEILRFVESLDGKYGITTLADVLAGSKVKKMKDFNLDKHPSYGYLSDKTRTFVLRSLNQLLDNKVVIKVGYDYPKLHLTDTGKMVLDATALKVSPVPFEEQKKHFLKKSYNEFCSELGYADKELVDAYIAHYFSNLDAKKYRQLLNRLKNQNDEVVYAVFLPYLIKEYRKEYEPVLAFIASSSRNSKYGLFVKQIFHTAKKEGEAHVS